MVDSERVRDRIVESGVVAVLRGVESDAIVPAAEAIHDAGVGALEVTADDPGAVGKVDALASAFEDTEAVVGAGTVLDGATASAVIDAGATFVVSPHTSVEVIRTCNRRGVLAAPGVMTPTEAATAMEAGADVLKVFPAKTVGPGHVSAIRGPFGDVDVVPTGGVSPEDVPAYFDAGAVAVGAGGSLVDHEAIADGDFDRVRETAAAFVDAVENARQS